MAEPAALSSAPVLTERARAKVNLTLHVLGRRADGYHELESLVAFADCADDLAFTPAPDLKLSVSGPRGEECGGLEDNLVLKAARLLLQRVPELALGRFDLRKVLPVAAGIGGGSADAAAALRLLARASGIAIDDARLIDVARATGADVSVCLVSRACMMMGLGEKLSPMNFPRLACVLINPGVPVATKDVFAALGLQAGQSAVAGGAAQPWPAATASSANWLAAIASGRNDLESPALRVQPVIADVLGALRAADGCLLARMSGSGATCFGLFGDDAAAARAAQHLAALHPRWWIEASFLS